MSTEHRRDRLAAFALALGAGVLAIGSVVPPITGGLVHQLAAVGLVALVALLIRGSVHTRTAMALALGLGLLLFLRRLWLTASAVGTDAVALEYTAFRGLVLLSGAAFIALGPRRGLWLSGGGLAAALLALHAPGGVAAGDIADAVRLALYTGVGIVMFRLLSITLQDVRERVETATEAAELAFLDDLTGLPNRRQMSLHLRASLTRAIEGGGPDAVVMFDLDHFKVVNDTMGHDVGDEVLRRVAGVSQSAMRDQDVLGRWGGEEFVVLLTGATVAEAVEVADRCRRLLALDAREPGITASFGVAAVTAEDTLTDLLRRADLALYEAKQRGRNRVVVDEGVSR